MRPPQAARGAHSRPSVIGNRPERLVTVLGGRLLSDEVEDVSDAAQRTVPFALSLVVDAPIVEPGARDEPPAVDPDTERSEPDGVAVDGRERARDLRYRCNPVLDEVEQPRAPLGGVVLGAARLAPDDSSDGPSSVVGPAVEISAALTRSGVEQRGRPVDHLPGLADGVADFGDELARVRHEPGSVHEHRQSARVGPGVVSYRGVDADALSDAQGPGLEGERERRQGLNRRVVQG
jgi:hypothetical protein